MNKRVLLLDGNNVYSRAWFAAAKNGIDKSTIKKAIGTFKGMLVKMRRELMPNHAVITCWDGGKDPQRLALLSDYKQREQKPSDYYSGIKILQEEMHAAVDMQYLQVQQENVEADDIIHTLATYYALTDCMVTIVSDDKDMLQLLSDQIVVSHSQKGMLDTLRFKESFGFMPANIVDYLALKGDDIDNIPGVAGIGEKTAQKLIQQFTTIEGLYANIDVLPAKQKKTLFDRQKDVLLYKQLIALKTINLDMTKLPD